MRTLTLLLSLSLLAVAAVGCTTTSDGSSDDPTTERQGFLEPCQTDAACADDLTCESGVCTRACDAADTCDAPGAAGYCGAEDADGRAFCAPLDASCPDPGPEPDGDRFACPPGETFRIGEAADGCPDWGCYPDADVCPEPGPSPDAFQCPPGERYALEPAADGCPEWGCYPNNDCPPREPFSGECAEGFDLVERPDANGCLEWDCVPFECPSIAAPPADFCPDGQRIVEILRENGCMDWGCAPDDCPVINIPQCSDDEEVQQTLDANGCPQLDCAPTDCPPLAAPPADSCPQGQRVALLPRAGLCPDWGCTTEGCEDAQEPEQCFDGQPANRPGLTPNGCNILTCDAERSFDCGPDMACSFDTQYCSVTVPGVEGASTSYTCANLPDACLQANSCECLLAEGEWSQNAGSCEDGGAPPGSASLTVTLFAP